MADLTITIGGRDFEVACRDGEEHFLQSAAGMLDNEAGALNEALGRMPETRMLLMAVRKKLMLETPGISTGY